MESGTAGSASDLSPSSRYKYEKQIRMPSDESKVDHLQVEGCSGEREQANFR